jgi:formate dehydrogenase subunit delta
MALETQVRMANDIAAQFSHVPHDVAVKGIANHLRSFWERRMCEQLLEAVDAADVELNPLVVEAAALLR